MSARLAIGVGGGVAVAASRAARRVREAVRAEVARGVREGIFPGAVVAVVRGSERLLLEAFGRAQVTPAPRPMTVETVFDLASVAKPFTATAVLHLCERGALELDGRVATWLPQFPAGGKEEVTIRHLLAHASGLPAWEMLYLPAPREARAAEARRVRGAACRTIPQAVARICATPSSSAPGARVDYSDLGFIILGHLIERLGGLPLGRYVRQHVTGPLGLRATRFRPPRAWRPRCAATEVGNAYERARAAALGLGRRFAWRTHLLRGEVHDGNAWHLGRGVAGHAGLFGTASDLVRFGGAMLRTGRAASARLLPAALIAEAARDQVPGVPGGPRGLGWSLQGQPFAGARASPGAFGHTGFTGTSMLVDPARDLVIVLLTNRVHPGVADDAISAFRPAFHDAVIEAVDG